MLNSVKLYVPLLCRMVFPYYKHIIGQKRNSWKVSMTLYIPACSMVQGSGGSFDVCFDKHQKLGNVRKKKPRTIF